MTQQIVEEAGRRVVPVLHGEKLRTLAKLIYLQEVNRIMTIPFASEYERGHCLRESREVYLKALSLTKQAADLVEATKNGRGLLVLPPKLTTPTPTPTPIPTQSESEELADAFGFFIETAVALANTGYKNINLRNHYLEKVQDYANDLLRKMEGLKDLPPSQAHLKAAELVEELSIFEQNTYEALVVKADKSSRFLAKAFKKPPPDFPHMVAKYHRKLVTEKGAEYSKEFERLTDEQKIEVYHETLRSSGRGTNLTNAVYKGLDGVARGLLFYTAATMAYDIFSSDNMAETAIIELTEFNAGSVGAAFGETIAAGISTAIVSTEVIEASTFVAAVVGVGTLVTGIAFGFVAGIAAGSLVGRVIDKFFHSGGQNAKINTRHLPAPQSVSKLHIYLAPMPDGFALAHKLAWQEDQ